MHAHGERRTDTGCDCRSGDRHLTARECQILPLIATGLNNERIGRRLGISTRTVDQHLVGMLRRAGAENRTELVARCYAIGILRSGAWPATWSGLRCLACIGQLLEACHVGWPPGHRENRAVEPLRI